ncbi:MAG: glycosyltransferase, partial [Syntrophales bacterium LBB04]|nr:glycosyltransferase [Syntrophales bacterium LBB04]
KRGLTKNNFYTLYDVAMLGLTSHSKVPLRLAAMLGFSTALLSLLAGFVYFIYKLIFWGSFSVGIAPLVIGLFVFSSVQLIFLGVVGEYVGAIHTHSLKRPLVIEKERINFDASAP